MTILASNKLAQDTSDETKRAFSRLPKVITARVYATLLNLRPEDIPAYVLLLV